MLAQAPARADIEHTARGFGWRIEVKASAAGLLTPVFWSAADIMSIHRPRACADAPNAPCLCLFFDETKGGSRRG